MAEVERWEECHQHTLMGEEISWKDLTSGIKTIKHEWSWVVSRVRN